MTHVGSLVIVDKVQAQTATYLTVASRTGLVTRPGAALASFSLTPAVAAEEAMDIGLKRGDVRLSFLQLDSRVGSLVLQSMSISQIRDTVDTIVEQMNLSVPTSVINTAHSRFISRLDHDQAYVTNKTRMGSLCIPGQSLYVLECDPAAYVLAAVNEAEKAANIRIVDFKITGSMGRLIISGTESNLRAARDATQDAVEAGT